MYRYELMGYCYNGKYVASNDFKQSPKTIVDVGDLHIFQTKESGCFIFAQRDRHSTHSCSCCFLWAGSVDPMRPRSKE